MIARNMSQLQNMLLKETRKAMNVVANKSLIEMYSETGDFYTGGEPKVYERTGALGDTPKTTAMSVNGKEISFNAYLDTTHRYTTGSNPSMLEVLNLANYGIKFPTSGGGMAAPTVGNMGFWGRAEQKIEDALDDTMRQFFN